MAKKFKLDAGDFEALIPNLGSCYASDTITVDGMNVGYLYREPPDNEIDSGWRFFSGTETQAYADDPAHFEIYDVNTICNYDPAIIPLLNTPPPCAFERRGDGWVEVEFEPAD